jgi:tryptophan synthase beta chain
LKDTGRATYLSATDDEALEAFQLCARLEGILPALEPSHALARVGEIAKDVGKGGIVVMNLCGRGDKDIFTIANALGAKI